MATANFVYAPLEFLWTNFFRPSKDLEMMCVCLPCSCERKVKGYC